MADTDTSSYILRYDFVTATPQYFTGSDWYEFSATPVTLPTLLDGKIWIGDSSNVATARTLSGGATVNNTGVVTLTNTSVTGQLLTGYSSGAGTVASTDSILAAIQKLNGNDALKAVAGAIGSSGLTQNTARMLGRTTASAGAIEEITVGSGLSLSAGTLTATGGAPGGSTNDVQLNNGSSGFTGAGTLNFNGSTLHLAPTSGNGNLYIQTTGGGTPFLEMYNGTTVSNIEIASSTLIIETNNYPVSINDLGDDGAGAASAVLGLRSTTRGFLPPVVTTTQRNAISSPATGLEVYNSTNNQPEFYNGTAWGVGITPSVQVVTQASTSTSSTTYVATALSAAFALSNASHKVKITYNLETEVTNAAPDSATVTIFADGVDIVPSSPTSGRGLSFVTNFGTNIDSMLTASFIYSPGDTASHTYDIRVKLLNGDSVLNAPAGDTNSNLIIEEVI